MQNPATPSRPRHRRGLTLVELTLVILALLTLVGLLFAGANSWKNGTDRARCILNIRQMQMSVRAFSTATSHGPGTDLSLEEPPVNLLGALVGAGNYVPELPTCPGNGLYFFAGDVVPETGSLYMTCSLALSQRHQPKTTESW
ncbi:MAG: hypothetical protein GWO24_32870 [Akkermansiaceae bacterium]|nr:hypothetical protein [Akkermansiaceae bacterium]